MKGYRQRKIGPKRFDSRHLHMHSDMFSYFRYVELHNMQGACNHDGSARVE
jgi:hypothetical protein